MLEISNEKFPLTMWQSNDLTPNVLCGTCGWIYVAKSWQDLAITAVRHKLEHLNKENN